MRDSRLQHLVAAVTALALLMGSVGPLVQQVCAGMVPTAPVQETCAHHNEAAGDTPCPHADRNADSGDAVAPPTMDCCDETAWNDGEALLPTRVDGALLNGTSIRSVRAPMQPTTTAARSVRDHHAPILSARMQLFLRHDAFLE